MEICGATARAHYKAWSATGAHGKVGRYERVAKEKTGRHDDHYCSGQVDGSVASILESTTPAKGRVSREVLVVLAQLSPDKVLGYLLARQTG